MNNMDFSEMRKLIEFKKTNPEEYKQFLKEMIEISKDITRAAMNAAEEIAKENRLK